MEIIVLYIWQDVHIQWLSYLNHPSSQGAKKTPEQMESKNEELIIETVGMFVSLHCRIFRLTPLNLRMGYICSPNHSMAVLPLLQKLQNTVAAFTSGLLISSNRFKSLLILLLGCLFLHFFQIHHPSSSSVSHT